MSEFQYVVFQAVDRPLNDRELAFAKRQSSRADVSRWSLSCEYHYSSFHGDVDGLLRRGYDVYLQYTNYGAREIGMRLPHGLPVSKTVWSKYIDGERLDWKKDSKGRGGILSLHPFHEVGDFEEVWEFQKYLDAAIQIRHRLMAGDLRSLYLLWLCSVDAYVGDAYDGDDDVSQMGPPVPYGLADLSDGSPDLLLFYGLDPLLLDAAAQNVDAAPVDEPQDQAIRRWVESLKIDRTRDLLCQLLHADTAAVKARLLTEVRDSQPAMTWPTTDKQLTFSELSERADALRSKANAKEARKAQAKAKRDAAKAERERQARMKQMVKDPKKWLRQAEELADARGTHNYEEAAEILFDLREAIGSAKGDEIVRQHAAHLAQKHPTLNRLKSALRKRGLLK